jgi:hypothetical protein
MGASGYAGQAQRRFGLVYLDFFPKIALHCTGSRRVYFFAEV